MEVTDITTRSVLKKSNTLNKKIKKVSFNNTVKLFIDDPSKNSKSGSISQMKLIEINIVDKSNDSLVPDNSFEDCKVTDFLVHKVIYDNYVLPDDNDLEIQYEEAEEDSIIFESTCDDDLEFVVHKVIEHEDDLIKKESEFDDTNVENSSISNSEANEDVVKELSELSIENILEHDKIIAIIDQKSLSLPSLHILNNGDAPNCGTNSPVGNHQDNTIKRLGLSPPLQELSLEKIVKAHSDNILAELDISPLNSVQETDSDSDLSSEGTMIMMTSEECKKNEQHIMESLLKYQSMKEKEAKLVTPVQFRNEVSNVAESQAVESTESEILKNNFPETNTYSEFVDIVSHSNDLTVESSYQLPNQIQYSCNPLIEPPPSKNCSSFSMSDVELLRSVCENSFHDHDGISGKGSLRDDSFWDKSLTSVEIPNDVREWKIFLNSIENEVSKGVDQSDHNDKVQSQTHSEIDRIYCGQNNSIEYQGHSKVFHAAKSDELESFVHENTERVERIRKRYLVNGKEHVKHRYFGHSPVRGIRPRFGSTAEILQLMQKQSNPPFYTFSGTKNHMSWPCEDTVSDPDIERNVRHKYLSNVYVSQSLSSDCSSQSSFDSDEHLNSSSCDQFSISSCPSILMQERGRPEGASPPRPGTEDCLEQSSYDEGYVYFSMKV